MLIDVFCEMLYALFYGSIHGIFHFWIREDRRTINGSIGLLCLRRLLEKVHGGLEGIFRTLARRVAFLVKNLEEHIVLLGHVVRTSAAVLHRRREANVGRWLGEEGGVEFVILEVAEDGFGGGNMGTVKFTLSSCIYRDLQVEFLMVDTLLLV